MIEVERENVHILALRPEILIVRIRETKARIKMRYRIIRFAFFFIQNVPIAICFVISHNKLEIRREISNFFISAIWFFLLDYKDKRFSNCFKHFNSHFCNTIL